MKEFIEKLFEKEKYSENDRAIFDEFLNLLNTGKIRAAEKKDGIWTVNEWVKKGILVGFKMGKIVKTEKDYLDKDTFPIRRFGLNDKVRIVPQGSTIRSGSYIAKGVVMMPPAYVNTGCYVDEFTMLDSHSLVGSCAQIGKRVHLSAAAQIGGVLEPINANPVIIEDEVFIGGNCGIYEGVIVKKRAIIAAGVIITSGTPVFDAVNDTFLEKVNGNIVIPENAVVVSGSRVLKSNDKFHIYCPIIIKYRDEKSDTSVKLEEFLR